MVRARCTTHDEGPAASNDTQADRRCCEFALKQQHFTVFTEVDVYLRGVSGFDDALHAMMDCYVVSSTLGIILELETKIFL
jgi:hypothetical protein